MSPSRLAPSLAVSLLLTFACAHRADPASSPQGGPPRAYRLLEVTPERETTQLTEQRKDIEIDTRDHERHPRVVAKGQTQVIALQGARARLYGDEKASAGFSVDNVLLVEVLDPGGKVLSRGAIGFSDGVLMGAERVDSIGKLSFTFEPGEVDLTSRLPESDSFQLRVTALDYFGVGRVSDVYLVLEHPRRDPADDDLRGE